MYKLLGYPSRDACVVDKLKYIVEDSKQPVLNIKINKNESCKAPCFSGTVSLEIIEKQPGMTRANFSQKFVSSKDPSPGVNCQLK